MVSNLRLVRLLQDVRRWRGLPLEEPLAVRPELAPADVKRLRQLVDDSISDRGGEPAARRRARTVALTYANLNQDGRHRFLRLLAEEYGTDEQAIDAAIDRVRAAPGPAARHRAESDLLAALQSRRQRLLHRLASIGGGLAFLVELREDLLAIRRSSVGLERLDDELRRDLESWFDVGLLELHRLTWDSSASFLEKLIEYEAVHAIHSWDELRRRLGPGRRCYAFIHPVMADEPLIFVEVALTKGMADSVVPFVSAPGEASGTGERNAEIGERNAEVEADTAIFYSISNCHQGLTGVSLGNFLIKSVVERLSDETTTEITNFATLSPLPKFRDWLTSHLDDDEDSLKPEEAERIASDRPGDARTVLIGLVTGPLPAEDDELLVAARPALMRLAAHYVATERRAGEWRALDPVTHFHLSNGARAERLNWMANPTPTGWERGLGMMINYRYSLRWIERNHDLYAGAGEVVASGALRRLAEG